MNIVDKIQQGFNAGNSWALIIVIFVISTILLLYFCYKKTIVSDWAYESIIKVPNEYEKLPMVQKWFDITRGSNYDIRNEPGKPLDDFLKRPANAKVRSDCLMTGFAFLHMLQHFCIAFFCPKLIPVSFIYGVGWEMIESVTLAHCTLDIFWNTIGCLLGLLLRSVLFPIHHNGIKS